MGRPAVKTKYKETKAAVKGRLRAEREEKYLFLDKRRKTTARLASFFDYISPHLDNIPKWAAYVGLTLMIKQAIETSEVLTAKAHAVLGQPWTGLLGMLSPLSFGFQVFAQTLVTPPSAEVMEAADKPEVELIEWLLAFTIAYVIVEHGGEIISAMGSAASSLSGVVGFLLA